MATQSSDQFKKKRKKKEVCHLQIVPLVVPKANVLSPASAAAGKVERDQSGSQAERQGQLRQRLHSSGGVAVHVHDARKLSRVSPAFRLPMTAQQQTRTKIQQWEGVEQTPQVCPASTFVTRTKGA